MFFSFLFFFLGESPAPEFYVATFRNVLFCSIFIGGVNRKKVKLEQTVCSETSAHINSGAGELPIRKKTSYISLA